MRLGGKCGGIAQRNWSGQAGQRPQVRSVGIPIRHPSIPPHPATQPRSSSPRGPVVKSGRDVDLPRRGAWSLWLSSWSAPADVDQQLRQVALDVIDQAEEDPLVHASQGRLPTSFSWRAIQTAHAIDVLPLINQLELTEELPLLDSSRQIKLLALRQEVMGRVLLAMIAVSSTAAHVSCEIERTYQVADRLKNSEQARIKQQTLWAVVIGGAAAVASGGLSLAESIGEGIAGIIGGTAAAALGISALYQESEQHFEHPDNVLREVWAEPTKAQYIPPSVWEFLNRPINEQDEKQLTFRQELVNGWRQEGRLGAAGSEEEHRRIQLLFADGGTYRSSDLVVRGQMLDMLRATIVLMNRELELLIREVMIQVALRKQPVKGDLKSP